MRIDLDKISTPGSHWSEDVAREVLKAFPDVALYTTAAGISPSGTVHFGNFRDVLTSWAVANALREKGVKTRAIFSWDNFDRLRKVPVNVPKEYEKYIGMPLSKVPSPVEGFASYAEYFQAPFEAAMKELGIELEYKNQTTEYESGRYDDKIFFALQNRKQIAEILLSFMTEKGKSEGGIDEKEYIENYFPISVYSRFTGKDITKVLSYDGETTITYKCIESGKEEAVDLSKEHIAKLAWKVDWPMRWQAEGVVFEPGGHDHASPGSSFDVATVIAEKVFGIKPPVFAEYKFVGIQGLGTKMSGSKGNAVSPLELLEIYEPELLKWLYLRKRPDQAFSLAFDTEIYRQYDEFDRENAKKVNNPIPFKQAVALGQIVLWDKNKFHELLDALEVSYDAGSISRRMNRAKNWLDKYNPEEVIKLNESLNSEYAEKLDEKTKEQVGKLKQALEKGEQNSIKSLEELVYSIPKDPNLSDKDLPDGKAGYAPAQKEFFKHIYNLLINKNAGPRLSTFLWAADREQILKLLSI